MPKKKPDPAIYLLAAQELNVDASRYVPFWPLSSMQGHNGAPHSRVEKGRPRNTRSERDWTVVTMDLRTGQGIG